MTDILAILGAVYIVGFALSTFMGTLALMTTRQAPLLAAVISSTVPSLSWPLFVGRAIAQHIGESAAYLKDEWGGDEK